MKKTITIMILGIFLLSLVSAVSCNEIVIEPVFRQGDSYLDLTHIRIKDPTTLGSRQGDYWQGYDYSKIKLPNKIKLESEEKIILDSKIPQYDFWVSGIEEGTYEVSVKFSWFCKKTIELNLTRPMEEKEIMSYDPSSKSIEGSKKEGNLEEGPIIFSSIYQEEDAQGEDEQNQGRVVELRNNKNKQTNKDTNSNKGKRDNNKGSSISRYESVKPNPSNIQDSIRISSSSKSDKQKENKIELKKSIERKQTKENFKEKFQESFKIIINFFKNLFK
jgi:hypothetical protein